ncbi:uncharacterized protein F5Z01DRAFT_670715 [Emericellopsis atlantica]|uniref:Uncharacterized protein n=1 Tax=Emericellopsis atlantica TaxID=2614577 RepID=A0A9P7ZUU3_9HYPO|nr:uncharacterized protein F5Z01DRAFT_670715 [Emericellopsis atlantica]KAG9258063.1 hypothetical protein F5Z01DRAFT_670715 [Emericellopsis atlantica]
MKRGWDAASHEDLLLCLIDHCKPNKAMVTDIAEQMRAKGYTYSYDAINQHIQKLRKSRDMSRLNEGANEESKSKPTTPAKRTVSAASTPRKRKTPTKKAKGKGAEDEQCDDEEEESFEDHMAKLEAEDDMDGDQLLKKIKTEAVA